MTMFSIFLKLKSEFSTCSKLSVIYCKFASAQRFFRIRMASELTEKQSSTKSFGGFQNVYSHFSTEVKTKMKFAVYLPPKAQNESCPVLYWLSGLSCTEQNVITKSGFQRVASECGLIVVCPDTSPRGSGIEGEDDHWDFGTSAAYYVDATEEKWKNNYRMYSYVTKELPEIVNKNFPVLQHQQSIFGHSVGGHGAIICALKNPGKYKSLSAFSPVSNPINCQWGQKAFTAFLGNNEELWRSYDSTELAKVYDGPKLNILIDQGDEDNFLQNQLQPENLLAACKENQNLSIDYRNQRGYDHSFYFISTFMEDHVKHHAKILNM